MVVTGRGGEKLKRMCSGHDEWQFVSSPKSENTRFLWCRAGLFLAKQGHLVCKEEVESAETGTFSLQ